MIFSLIHLVNLFDGASPGAVLMQIGYTFLVGGMCAVVLVASKSVWICVAVHAVYNFCGTIVPRLGETQGWDTPTIIVTTVLASCTCILYVRYLFRSDAEAKKLIET